MATPQNNPLRERCYAEETYAYISCLMGRPKSLNSWCLLDRQRAFETCMQKAEELQKQQLQRRLAQQKQTPLTLRLSVKHSSGAEEQ